MTAPFANDSILNYSILLPMDNTSMRFGNLTYWDWIAREHDRQWREFPLTLHVFCLIMSVLSIAGAAANLYVAICFLFVDALRKLQYTFIANLTVIDLTITLIVMPLNVVNTVYGPTFWRGKSWACELVGSLCATLCTASVWSIMAIALERYICICHYSRYIRFFTGRLTVVWLLCLWTIANFIHLPNFIGWGHTSYAKDFYLCTGDLALASYSAFWAIFSVLLPTCVTFYAYLQIYLTIRVSKLGRNLIAGRGRRSCQQQEPAASLTHPDNTTVDPLSHPRNYRIEIKLVKALFRVFLIFLVSWLPVGILFTINNGYTAPKWVNLAALILAHGNSATNSVVYFWLNSHLRESYLAFRRFNRCPTQVQPTVKDELSVKYTATVMPSGERQSKLLHYSQTHGGQQGQHREWHDGEKPGHPHFSHETEQQSSKLK